MVYYETICILGQPDQKQYLLPLKQHRKYQDKFEAAEMPHCYIAVASIGAVLWDPAEQVDEEGDYAYLLLLDGKELMVYSKNKAAEFLCYVFDYNARAKRDWQQRLSTDSSLPRTDFATRDHFVCHKRLPFTSVEQCGIALVPANVTSVNCYKEHKECTVMLRGAHQPLLLETAWTSKQFSSWLFDADNEPEKGL